MSGIFYPCVQTKGWIPHHSGIQLSSLVGLLIRSGVLLITATRYGFLNIKKKCNFRSNTKVVDHVLITL
jgi:hypothetical protein